MANIYNQKAPVVLDTAASLAASGSVSGSMVTDGGYARIVGMGITSGSLTAASGLRIYHSLNHGQNWDHWDNFTISSCSGSGFSASLVGNAVMVKVVVGESDADVFRLQAHLIPIW